MYPILLTLHSLLRWFVLASLLLAVYRAYKGWFTRQPFSSADNTIRHITATIAHIQLLTGLWLYFISPVMAYFFKHLKQAIHVREIRFFGMEHSILMLIAIVIITIGSALAKRRQTDEGKFKIMAIWFSIGLLIIILAIPWPFSPFTSRPFFRLF
jgi:cytochrome b561